MTDRIDWEALVERIREIDGRPEFAATVEGARHAVELLVGTDRLRQAVDEFVADDLTGTADLIEGVLRAIRPPSAAAYCYEISRSSADVWDRHRAVRVLRYVADRQALPWIGEFLDDPERGIGTIGLEVLAWLLWTEEVEPDDCEDLLRRAETHRDSQVRSRAARIREDVDRRRGIDSQGSRGLAIATQRRETLIGLNRTDTAMTTRRAAVELLTAIADRRALPLLDEMLGDPDDETRALGFDALDALLREDVVWPEDCETRLPRVADHPDPRVRAKVAAMREYLARLPS